VIVPLMSVPVIVLDAKLLSSTIAILELSMELRTMSAKVTPYKASFADVIELLGIFAAVTALSAIFTVVTDFLAK
jgi:hypothetical protein